MGHFNIKIGGTTLIDYKKFFSEEELIKLTQELVRIPSHKDAENREKEAAEYIYKFSKRKWLRSRISRSRRT